MVKKNKALSALILLEILIIVFLGLNIYKAKENVLSLMTINPIRRIDVVFNPAENLKYFYEPAPNTEERVNPWVPMKAVYTINSDGLNERFDYNLEKKSTTFRIITLGDSFTYGLYVDTEDNWAEVLEDVLNAELSCKNLLKFEVINLGVHGYDIQYSVERFRRRGQKYNPDIAVWFIRDQDIIQINEVMLEKERRYADQMQASGEFDREVKKGNYYPSWSKAFRETYQEIGEENILKTQGQFLAELRRLYKKPLVIITFATIKSKYKAFLKNFADDSSDTYFFDQVTDIFQHDELHFISDNHPNQKGHKKIAEDIFNYLIENQLIPCK